MLIAERTLKLETPAGTRGIGIKLYAPVREDGDWSCTYEIMWPDAAEKRKMYGLDAMQAVNLTLQMLGTTLYASEAHKSGKLYWEKPGGGYGFPVPPNMRDVLVGNDKIEFGQ